MENAAKMDNIGLEMENESQYFWDLMMQEDWRI